MNKKGQQMIVEPPFFSNWADLFMPKIANFILPFIARTHWITPNFITLFSFSLYVLGCVMIFIDIPYHYFLTAILLPIAYIGDCLDGQLARAKNLSSQLGNYLDKVVDVLKIYIVTLSLGYGAYLNTENVLYVFLGFTACFFFNYRYYIKLETIFSQCNLDPTYLSKCKLRRQELYQEKEHTYSKLTNSFMEKMELFWLKNRTIFFVDEAEFVVFTALGALFGQLEIALWVLATSQVCIAFWRVFERGYQVHTKSKKLLDPMRK